METNKFTVTDIIIQIISDNQLPLEDEIKIKEIIERKHKKEDGRKDRCLADVIKSEIIGKMSAKDSKIKNISKAVYKKCFMKSGIGNTDSSELTEKKIKEFEKTFRSSSVLNKDERICFMALLQTGLNILSNSGMLGFVPDKKMFDKFLNSEHIINYIENPYSEEETEKIMKWAEEHPTDVRGIAVSLWFTKGISLTEIVNLTKKDCWNGVREKDSIMMFDKNLFNSSIRSEIVWKSLNLHPKEEEDVFVIPKKDGRGWEKFTEGGLQKKLWYICKEIGITYKRIYPNEAIFNR